MLISIDEGTVRRYFIENGVETTIIYHLLALRFSFQGGRCTGHVILIVAEGIAHEQYIFRA